jgi:hypothetical protein
MWRKHARGARGQERVLSPRVTLFRVWSAAGRVISRLTNPPRNACNAEALAGVTQTAPASIVREQDGGVFCSKINGLAMLHKAKA